jgi:hypothetical protein
VFAEAAFDAGGSDMEEMELGENSSLNITSKRTHTTRVGDDNDDVNFDSVCAQSMDHLPSDIVATLEDLSWADESAQVFLVTYCQCSAALGCPEA